MSRLIPLEFKNQRIITTKVLSEEFGTNEQNISKNFTRNQSRFIEGKHYFKLEGQELKKFKGYVINDESLKYVSILYLWTDRGAARHAKILDTDEAWDIYEELEENYFNPKESKVLDSYMIEDPIKRAEAWIKEQQEKETLKLQNAQLIQQNGELKTKADYTDLILKNKGLVTITQIAKDYGMSPQEMNKKLHELKIQYKQSGQWLLYAQYHDKGYTHSETIPITRSDGRPDISMTTKWTQKGRLFLYDLLKEHEILPMIEREVAS
ncbi:phage antirepressor KilAC domain-containing protein [Clostridium neonatale]|uniref:phage antirepressor KilAC domain-containing protein n=1 Tax=Clostridium neonatale TaxID=137838 RepID=UPI00291B46CE|nr:phage antirepressor KilAC domain-containing protein [Clostridium neonatale]CAI3700477.1 anti-repressor protein [Clostridium neonatale]CAI3703969.1 anti-repressor protein [Clostridium neonatale]